MSDEDCLDKLINLSPYRKTCKKIKKEIMETIQLNDELRDSFKDFKVNCTSNSEALKKLLYFLEFAYFSSDEFLNENI